MKKLIAEWTKLKEQAEVRASVISFSGSGETEEDALIRRTEARAAADTYAYCILRLRDLI